MNIADIDAKLFEAQKRRLEQERKNRIESISKGDGPSIYLVYHSYYFLSHQWRYPEDDGEEWEAFLDKTAAVEFAQKIFNEKGSEYRQLSAKYPDSYAENTVYVSDPVPTSTSETDEYDTDFRIGGKPLWVCGDTQFDYVYSPSATVFQNEETEAPHAQ